MTHTQIPDAIQHLDFNLDEKPEEPKTCQLRRIHPADPDGPREECGRLAVYELSLDKQCGHVVDIFICQGCWNEVENQQDKMWRCMFGNPECGTSFDVRKSIVRWEKIR